MVWAANPPWTQKSKHDLHSAFSSLISTSTDSAKQRSQDCCTYARKSPASKWTLAVQTPVVPGSSVKRETAGRLLEEGVTDVLKGAHWLPGAEWTRVEEGKACWETSWIGEQWSRSRWEVLPACTQWTEAEVGSRWCGMASEGRDKLVGVRDAERETIKSQGKWQGFLA